LINVRRAIPKKGRAGTLYLTKAPEIGVVSPIIVKSNIVKTRLNQTMFFASQVKVTFLLNMLNTAKKIESNMIIFSNIEGR